MTTTLVLPIAGASTRFGGLLKWMQRNPITSNFMLVDAILGIAHMFENILIIPLEKHYVEFPGAFREVIYSLVAHGFVSPVIAPIVVSSSQPETVYKGLQVASNLGKPVTGNFMVKDCDNYWVPKRLSYPYIFKELGSYVVYANLSEYPDVPAQNKSYITFDGLGVIDNIVEKKVISDNFCVGGYGFESVRDYSRFYNAELVPVNSTEKHLSHVIYASMLYFKEQYKAVQCDGFSDWGTADDWIRYLNSYGE